MLPVGFVSSTRVCRDARRGWQAEELEELGWCTVGQEAHDSLWDRSAPVKLRKPACPPRDWHFRGKWRCFVLLVGKAQRFGSVVLPCSSLQPWNGLLYKHKHVVVFQRGSMFVQIPICLGSLYLWGAAGLKVWEAWAAKEITWHCFCVCPCCSLLAVNGGASWGQLVEIPPASFAPLCLLTADVDMVN